MSENLMETVAPHLSPPVTRQPLGAAAESEEGVSPSVITIGGITVWFAADDDE